MGLEFWIVFLVVISVAAYRALKGSFYFYQNLSKFLGLGFSHDLLVLALFGLVGYELELWRNGLHEPSALIFLLFILSFSHFIPRILVFTTVGLQTAKPVFNEDPQLEKLREGVLDFAEGTIREVMVPINDLFLVPRTATFQEILDHSDYTPYSRIPIYQDEPENIVGILYAKDLIDQFRKSEKGLDEFTIDSLVRPAYYIPEVMEQAVLLQEFKRRRIHMAIVVDEFGVITGLVTLEDLMETIVGEVQDKKNDDEILIHHQGGREWVLDAMIQLDDFSELVGLEIDSESVDTLGGFVFEAMGHLPEVGERLFEGDLEYQVLELEKYRIRKIGVRRVAL